MIMIYFILLINLVSASASMYENFYSIPFFNQNFIHSTLTNSSVLIGVGVFSGLNTLSNVLFMQPSLKQDIEEINVLIDETQFKISKIKADSLTISLWDTVIKSQNAYAKAKEGGRTDHISFAWEKYCGMHEEYEKYVSETGLSHYEKLLEDSKLLKTQYESALRWSYYKSIGSFLTLSSIIGYRYWHHYFSRCY